MYEKYREKKILKVLNGLPLGALVSETRAGKVKAVAIAEEITIEKARSLIDESDKVLSYIGHKDTAVVLSNLLEREIAFNRGNATLNAGDRILVCAYFGPRLKEGETELPEDAGFRFFEVRVYEKSF